MSAQSDRIEALLTRCIALLERQASAPSAASAPNIAPDHDLDGQWGDPEVRKDSPQWIKLGGESYVGRKFSECPADYLEALASFFDWKAGKDEADGSPEKLKYAGYSRKDAGRARGWAKRNRENPPKPRTEIADPF